MSVLLPHTTRTAAPSDEAGPAPELGGSELILVVEDEPLVRQTVLHYLARGGYQVLEASDGQQALAMLETRDDVDLLLTDMVLPRMGGPELARAASELRPGLGMLFMSAYPKVKLVREGQLPDDAPLLQKPFAEDELLLELRKLLDEGRVARSPAGETLLLVEDEPMAREATQLLLEEEGYAVLAAANGAEALTLARAQGHTIDAVVTDLNLPGTKPHELVAELIELAQPRALIVISGNSHAPPEVTAIMQRVSSVFLRKPLEIDTLVATIQRLIG